MSIASLCDLKAAQMNVQRCLIWELKLELDHDAAEATKSISCTKLEETVSYSPVTWWLKNFLSGYMNFDNL